VQEFGHFTHSCQKDIVCKSDIESVPYFNAPIYFEDKTQIGKVDEIFGTVRNYFISVTLGEGITAHSFKTKQKVSFRNYHIAMACKWCCIILGTIVFSYTKTLTYFHIIVKYLHFSMNHLQHTNLWVLLT
jgi:rRNA processing protein Gar1